MLSIALVLLAQTQATLSPYAGQESRAIKALSAEELHGLREGAGLGLGKAAELNGYPGPKHVLELAQELGLSPVQQVEAGSLFVEMQADAIEHGARVIEEEAALESLFRAQEIDDASLREQLARIASARADLRLAHLKAHLKMKNLLSERQAMRYNHLRGYSSGTPLHGHH
jgi:hypothetical protein